MIEIRCGLLIGAKISIKAAGRQCRFARLSRWTLCHGGGKAMTLA